MSQTRRRRHVRWIWITGVTALAVGAVCAALWLRPWAHETTSPNEGAEPVTATVELATLTSQVRLNAQLSYGDPAPLPAAAGTITVLPTAGAVVEVGQQVYESDGHPVVLFNGARPFWRELSVDADDGEDVRQLEQNLSNLGFAPGDIDGRFDWMTRQAVRDWQESLGLESSGVFSPSSVVVVDAPGIRIAQVTTRLGEAGTSPATFTETALRATAKLTAAQARTLTTGTPVIVELSDGTMVDRELSAIDPGGRPTGDGDATTSPTATIEFPDQTAVAAVGAVAVRIVIVDDEEQLPTLVVPVTALLATADGGYAVEVYDGDSIRRTSVQLGLVADARAQILASGSEVGGVTGAPLASGDLVVLAR